MNDNLEYITGVDPNIKGVNTTGMTTSMDNITTITYDEGIEKDVEADKEDDDSRK